jgi:hypothetical protein|tara:strand:+ start:1362 stop:2039 length:678 start_codon:yes stop_codon:yes gene_type:complete
MKELVDALVKAQSQMTHGLATGSNPHFNSEYAPLDEVIKAVKKPLNDNGIFFLQKVYLADNGQCVETEFHGHGAVVSGGKVYVVADKKTPQGYGSALTYAKRYSLQTACGLPTGDDDDGNQAEEDWDMAEAEKEKPKPKKEEPVKEEPKEKDDFDYNEDWAELFVDSFVKTLTVCETKEEAKGQYTSNEKSIIMLREKFPEQKKRLDNLSKQFVENLNEKQKEAK